MLWSIEEASDLALGCGRIPGLGGCRGQLVYIALGIVKVISGARLVRQAS
jgi:hypothetical protein